MAITFTKKKEIQKYLVPIFIIILLITAIVIWWGFSVKEKPVLIKEILKPPKEIEINFEILKSPILGELESFEKIPSFEEEIGRKNPFLPF
jgi:hypothetical protein